MTMRQTQGLPRISSVALIGCVVVMIGLAGVGIRTAWASRADASEILSAIPSPDPDRPRPATLETAWPMVAARASEWDKEARLFSLSAQYDWPTSPTAEQGDPAGGWLIFVFVREHGEQTEALSMMVERNSAVIARETVSLLGTEATGVDPTAFIQSGVGSIRALELATETAGRSFRDECRATRFVTRQTFQPAVSGVGARWMLTYNDTRVRNGPALSVIVDASTGESTATRATEADPSLDTIGPCPR